MPIPGDRQDKLPQPVDRLPALDPSEEAQILRMARLAKAGRLRQFTIKIHEQKNALDAEWTLPDGGGGRLLR